MMNTGMTMSSQSNGSGWARLVDRRSRLSNSVEVFYPAGDIWVRAGYVLVRDREIASLAIAREALATIDAALIENDLHMVVFDTRELHSPSEAVNALYWEWVMAGANHDRVALLVKSEMKRVEGNMRALSKRVQLRSFHDLADAEMWLARPLPKPRG